MDNGIKIDYGQKIGKTIIFAKNHTHAEKIFEVFNGLRWRTAANALSSVRRTANS